MKFSEMTYTRPDIDALLADCKALAAKAAAAPDGDALVAVYYEQSRAFADYTTASQLANIHYTCDTRDASWKAEQDFFDANGPAVANAQVEISRAFLSNPHVDALTEHFGTTCVAGMKNAVLGMDDRTVDLQKEFNALVSQYQQVYGGALVELDGKQLTIPQLGPYKEDLDPAVRRAAYEAEAGYFDAHRAELDELYGKIVQNLNQQAHVLGYKDYSELSYVRMNRIGYGAKEIKAFRDQVANDVVPLLQKVMAMRAKRTGIEHPTFTDLPIIFQDGNPKPIPGMESAEIHSMAMEFLTAPWHHLLFGKDTDKYALLHAEDSFVFLAYGCEVDEFQHIMYQNPDLTPDERNAEWLKLEKKYRPWIDFDNLPFYGRGAGWQRQLHIYECPFYYIDYCLSTMAALQFFLLSLTDHKDAWERYLRLVRRAGLASYTELLETAGLKVPFEDGSIKGIAQQMTDWLEAHQV